MWTLNRANQRSERRTESVTHLLLGDVRLNKLLQDAAVVDVSVPTGAQRPVSLSVAQHRFKLNPNCHPI